MNDYVDHEETVRSSKVRRGNSQVYTLICYFLMNKNHQHMLKMTNDEKREFEITFTDRKTQKWHNEDNSLFDAIDSKIPRDRDGKVNSKERFRANMHRLVNNGYLEHLGTTKISTSITIKKYRLLECLSKDVLESKMEAINLKAEKIVIKESNQCRKEIKAPSEKSLKSKSYCTAMNQNKRKRNENICDSLKKLKKYLPTQDKLSPQPGPSRKDGSVCLPSTVSPTLSLPACPPDPVTETSAQPENSSGISPLHDMRNDVFKSIPAETFVPKSSPDLQGETVYEENKRNDELGAFEDGRYELQFITIGNYPCYSVHVGSNGLDVCATDKIQTTNSNEDNCYGQDVGSNGLDVCATDKFQTNHSDEDNLLLYAEEIQGSNGLICATNKFKLFSSNEDNHDLGAIQMNEMEFRSSMCEEDIINQIVLDLDDIPVNEKEYRSDLSEVNNINRSLLDLDDIPVNEEEYRSDLSEVNNVNQSLLDLDAIQQNKMEYRYGSSDQNNINPSALNFDNLCRWLHMDDGNCDVNCK